MQGKDESTTQMCSVSFLVAISVGKWIPPCARRLESVQSLLFPTVFRFLVQSLVGRGRPSMGMWDVFLSGVDRSCYLSDVKPMVGMIKSILDGSSQDTGEITVQVSQHAHTVLMSPLCIKAANMKGRGKENRNGEITYGELRSSFVGLYFSIDQFACKLDFARGAVIIPLHCCDAYII